MNKYSWKFWLIFWLVAALLLAGWFVYLQVKNRNFDNLKPFLKVAPVSQEKKGEMSVLLDIFDKIGGFDEEKNLLILFQNDLELRPSGGFIGAFGVAKVKNGKIEDIQVFDTGNFDKSIPDSEIPSLPYPEDLGAARLAGKMRDSNWSPDFEVNAEKAEYFYKLGGGKDNIDGVVAINTSVLNSILSIIGPVKINGYPGEYKDENAILQLEYQVEKGYAEQGIAKGERKNIMGELADILAEKIHNLSISQQLALLNKLETHLNQKDIQLFFKDENLQSEIENIDWAGRVKEASSDYLMIVDANLNALKSDYCIKRRADYAVDLSGNNPQAILKISYDHTCRAKDWMTSDYRDWLRVYVPAESYLEEANGQDGDVYPHTNNANSGASNIRQSDNIGVGVKYSEELGKKVFGMLVNVPIGESKTIELKYQLPESVKENYNLFVQKQSGSGELPMDISVKKPNGSEVKVSEILRGDKEFAF